MKLKIGDWVKVHIMGNEYEGEVVGLKAIQAKHLVGGEVVSIGLEVSVRCSCCGVVQTWNERYVSEAVRRKVC